MTHQCDHSLPPRHDTGTGAARRCVAVLLAVTVLGAGASCSASGAEVSASKRSDVRPETSSELDRDGTGSDPGSAPGAGSEFCDRISDFARESADADAATLDDLLADLHEVAPEEIADDIEVIQETVSALREVSENDLESFGRMLDSLLAPEFRRAIGNLGGFALEECGVTLGENPFDGLGGG